MKFLAFLLLYLLEVRAGSIGTTHHDTGVETKPISLKDDRDLVGPVNKYYFNSDPTKPTNANGHPDYMFGIRENGDSVLGAWNVEGFVNFPWEFLSRNIVFGQLQGRFTSVHVRDLDPQVEAKVTINKNKVFSKGMARLHFESKFFLGFEYKVAFYGFGNLTLSAIH